MRKQRKYRMTDKDYLRAKKRADKEGKPLALQVEQWVKAYGEGKVMIMTGAVARRETGSLT